MKVCYFSTFDRNSFRTCLIQKGLRFGGVEVKICHSELWGDTSSRIEFIEKGWLHLSTLWRIFKAYCFLIVRGWRDIKDCDAVIVAYPGYFDVFLAKLLCILRRKPLIFDVYPSLYETVVLDRRLISPKSVKAKLIWLLEEGSCQLAED